MKKIIIPKNYYHPTFIQYKKTHINLFSLYHMKKKLNKKIKVLGHAGGPDPRASSLALTPDATIIFIK